MSKVTLYSEQKYMLVLSKKKVLILKVWVKEIIKIRPSKRGLFSNKLKCLQLTWCIQFELNFMNLTDLLLTFDITFNIII